MAVPARVSVVTLGARDLPRLRRFYQSLGWPEAPDGTDEFTSFRTGGAVLALWTAAELHDEAGAAQSPGGFALSINVPERDDVDRAVDEMLKAGAALVTAPEDKFWRGRSGNVADPEGNPWEVAWNPHWPLTERGAIEFAD
jgi:uncharacterized glyoxalase superfamily protein PhnB